MEQELLLMLEPEPGLGHRTFVVLLVPWRAGRWRQLVGILLCHEGVVADEA
jgi:hypothetical protein